MKKKKKKASKVKPIGKKKRATKKAAVVKSKAETLDLADAHAEESKLTTPAQPDPNQLDFEGDDPPLDENGEPDFGCPV